jgi:hypothetical protein
VWKICHMILMSLKLFCHMVLMSFKQIWHMILKSYELPHAKQSSKEKMQMQSATEHTESTWQMGAWAHGSFQCMSQRKRERERECVCVFVCFNVCWACSLPGCYTKNGNWEIWAVAVVACCNLFINNNCSFICEVISKTPTDQQLMLHLLLAQIHANLVLIY